MPMSHSSCLSWISVACWRKSEQLWELFYQSFMEKLFLWQLSLGASDKQTQHADVHVTWPPAIGLIPPFLIWTARLHMGCPQSVPSTGLPWWVWCETIHARTSPGQLSCRNCPLNWWCLNLIRERQTLCHSVLSGHDRDDLPYQEGTSNFDVPTCQMMSRPLLLTNIIKYVRFRKG